MKASTVSLAALKEARQMMARSGGKARAAALSAAKRSEIAQKAAVARWAKWHKNKGRKA